MNANGEITLLSDCLISSWAGIRCVSCVWEKRAKVNRGWKWDRCGDFGAISIEIQYVVLISDLFVLICRIDDVQFFPSFHTCRWFFKRERDEIMNTCTEKDGENLSTNELHFSTFDSAFIIIHNLIYIEPLSRWNTSIVRLFNWTLCTAVCAICFTCSLSLYILMDILILSIGNRWPPLLSLLCIDVRQWQLIGCRPFFLHYYYCTLHRID